MSKIRWKDYHVSQKWSEVNLYISPSLLRECQQSDAKPPSSPSTSPAFLLLDRPTFSQQLHLNSISHLSLCWQFSPALVCNIASSRQSSKNLRLLWSVIPPNSDSLRSALQVITFLPRLLTRIDLKSLDPLTTIQTFLRNNLITPTLFHIDLPRLQQSQATTTLFHTDLPRLHEPVLDFKGAVDFCRCRIVPGNCFTLLRQLKSLPTSHEILRSYPSTKLQLLPLIFL